MRAPSPVEEAAFRALCRKVERERGFYCSSYKDSCLRRRFAVRMRVSRAPSFQAYAHVLDSNAAEYEQLMTALTINVSKFFRNPETFACIAARVLPELWRSTAGEIRIWSAGCASGEEPYSIAALCCEAARSRGATAASRFSIYASDVDEEALAVAEAGLFPPSAFVDVTPAVIDRYFPLTDECHAVASDVRTLTSFHCQDLLEHGRPSEKVHLILCRNVIIYLKREAQERLINRFHELLLPGGFLVLGKVETLLGETRELFAPVSSRERVYRRA